MRYLCSTHQSHLFSQSYEQQSSTWLDWIMRAAVFYQRQYWLDALPFLGCGFELSAHQLQTATKEIEAAAEKLCLSAIYLANVLRHCDQVLEAQAVMMTAIDQLLARENSLNNTQRFIALLMSPHLHQSFFQQYFNLPFIQAADAQSIVH